MGKSVSKRIILVVTNDLEGDQRLHKVASSLQKYGWDPVLVGRLLPGSGPLSRSYKVIRKKLVFKRGPMFYACFNIRIFFYLLFQKADLFVANDLDTLPGVWCASRLRGKPIIFDSHEYFTEVPELLGRIKVQKVWKRIERRIQPRLKNVITVNESIAKLFRKEYNQEVTVISNFPNADPITPSLGHLPDGFTDKPIIIYQGAVNIGRGIEEMIFAMHDLAGFNFLIVGGGDKLEELRDLVKRENLVDRIYIVGRVPFESLPWYTKQATIGMSLEQDIGLNYRLALPNKLFDYMHAGIPVLASNLPEISRVVNDAACGVIISGFSPEEISEGIDKIHSDKQIYKELKGNALRNASKYTWGNQENALIDHYMRALDL